MEKIKSKYILLFIVLIFSKTYSQEQNIIRKGLIKSDLTLSASKMFSENQSYFYLHGGIEGYVSPKITLSGEGYYYLGALSSNESTYKYNHNLFFGASKHFTNKNSDLYIGLQPGVSFTKLNETANNLTETHMGVNPLFSSVMGYNYYVTRFFHFFVQARIITGSHNYDIHKNLTEVRFSAGLGLNLNTIKNN